MGEGRFCSFFCTSGSKKGGEVRRVPRDPLVVDEGGGQGKGGILGLDEKKKGEERHTLLPRGGYGTVHESRSQHREMVCGKQDDSEGSVVSSGAVVGPRGLEKVPLTSRGTWS